MLDLRRIILLLLLLLIIIIVIPLTNITILNFTIIIFILLINIVVAVVVVIAIIINIIIIPTNDRSTSASVLRLKALHGTLLRLARGGEQPPRPPLAREAGERPGGSIM